MKPQLLISVALLIALAVASETRAQELRLRAPDWITTGADNSLARARSLFRFRERFVVTRSDATNIHSHYRDPRLAKLRNYTFTGQMRIANPGGGIGVTFHSRYRRADRYYRLRYYPGGPGFEIAPHPDGVQLITDGVDLTDLVPTAGSWYNFKVLVRSSTRQTRIKAKIWPVGAKQPRYQIDASDQSDRRITYGRLGLWSMGTGEKRWRRLNVSGIR